MSSGLAIKVSGRPRAIATAATRGRLAWVAVVLAADVVAVTSSPKALHASALLVSAALIWWQASRLARAKKLTYESTTWTALSVATRIIACGLGLEGLTALTRIGGVAMPSGVALMVLGLVASGFIFVGLVHWNRFRTHLADPGEWLNAACAVLAVVAAGLLVVQRTDPAVGRWSSDRPALWLAQIGVLLVLGCTGALVAPTAGLTHDRRIWMITTASWVGMLANLAAGVLGGPDAALIAVQLSWTTIAVAVLVAYGSPAAPPDARAGGSTASTGGTLSVLIVGVSVLGTAGATDGRAATQPLLLAAASIVGCASRMVFAHRDLARLAESHQLARTDPLTGVANRRGMRDALREASMQDTARCLLVVDLDRFKEVNDRFGHMTGDEVLRVMSQRLRAPLPARGLLARIGGDEFAVLLPGAGVCDAERLAAALLEVVCQPIVVAGRPTRLSASIGMSSCPGGPDGIDDLELFRRADTAMYVAKRAGGGLATFDDEADQKSRGEQALLDDLRLALGRDDGADPDQMVVYFQPQLDLQTGRVVGAEALVRWVHPRLGLVQPGAFLEMVERDGLMLPLTTCVLDQALAASRIWLRRGHQVSVSVNLSTQCLVHPELLATIDTCLRRHGLPSEALVIEITETSLMSDPEQSLAIVNAMAERGLGISIDDYGTGYSSLAYLNDLPAAELKLDRSLIARVGHDPRTEAIVAGTADLAHHLGLRVVAEGVETQSTMDRLRTLQCDVSQGYLHARPMPLNDLLAWLDVSSTGAQPVTAPARGHPVSL